MSVFPCQIDSQRCIPKRFWHSAFPPPQFHIQTQKKKKRESESEKNCNFSPIKNILTYAPKLRKVKCVLKY